MCTWVPVWIYAPFMYDYIHVCAWDCVSLSSSVHFCICTSFVRAQYFVCACVCDCSFVKNIHLCLWISCIYLFSCACMSVFACVGEFLYVYTCPWVGMHRHNSIYIHTDKYWYVAVYMHMWLCIWANVQLCICAFWNVWTCVPFFVCLYIHMFVAFVNAFLYLCFNMLICLSLCLFTCI